MSETGTPNIDAAKAKEFSAYAVSIVNSGALMMMISIGHQTGLFDKMATLNDKFRTSEEIAAAAGLNERYVREWLAAMATGRIVEFDANANTYRFPAEHAIMLTRSSPKNIGVIAQCMPMAATIEEDLVKCFRNGGGVPYERYEGYHKLTSEMTYNSFVAPLESILLPGLGIQDDLKRGVRLLDVGCGRGQAIIEMAKRYPNSNFVGYDMGTQCTEDARRLAAELGLKNIQFAVHEAERLGELPADQYDIVTTFDTVHEFADPDKALRGVAHVLKPGGKFVLADVNMSSELRNNMLNPLAPLNYSMSTFCCMTVSLARGGAGLGTCWGRETAKKMLIDAGFSNVEFKTFSKIPNNMFFVSKL